jgi:hypothetical protein
MVRCMEGDVDIMGVQRGEHKDGAEVCPKFVFKTPGGVQPDGTPLWGWNDAKSASCARCGQRDLDHVVLRDYTKEAMEKDRIARAAKVEARAPARPPPAAVSPGDAASAPLAGSTTGVMPARERVNPLQMYELEPGVPDPLAISAYQEAERQHRMALQRAPQPELAAAPAPGATAAVSGDGSGGSEEDENERFKAEVERMVREKLTKERVDKLAAPPSEGGLSVREVLERLGLSQYTASFEEEGMEMGVLVSLARSEDGKAAVDEALKELGVKSVGHRLKIFAALHEGI